MNEDQWRGIDIEEEMGELGGEYTQASPITDKDLDPEPKKKFGLPSFGGGGSTWKKPVLIGGGVLLAILLVGGLAWMFLGGNNGDKQAPGKPNSQQTATTSNKEGLSKSAYQIFVAGIKDSINGNNAKKKVGNDWRDATIAYGETNDLEAYKAKLIEINETRKAAVEAIPNNEYPFNQHMIETLNMQRDFLNRAYEATSSEQAIEIYNEWGKVNIERNNTYIDIVIVELDKAGIPYSKSTSDDGAVKIDF